MKKETMKDYSRRLVKYIGFILILIAILIALQMSRSNTHISDFYRMVLGNKRMQLFLAVFFAYSFLYPLLVYGKKVRHINGSFEDNREGFMRSFADTNFLLAGDTGNKLIFRRKSVFSRIMSMGEDRIVVDYSSNPVIMSGIRKETRVYP